jgi:hypothetical protein
MDKKPDYQIIKKPSLVDKIIQLVQRRVARSRYQRDLELITRTEENDEAIKPTFYRGYNAQLGQAIVQELGQNSSFTSNLSNGFIPQNQQIEYIKSNGGSSGNFIPTTRQKQIRRERVRRIIIEVFGFKTAQVLFMGDENWDHIKSELIKSGDNQDSVLETIENTYMVGFVNYSSDPDDYLLIVQKYNNNNLRLGYFGYNKNGEQWAINTSSTLTYFEGGYFRKGTTFLSTPTHASLRLLKFTNGARTEDIQRTYFATGRTDLREYEFKTITNTASSDYSAINRHYTFELNRQRGGYVYKGSNMNFYTETETIETTGYQENIILAYDSQNSITDVYFDGVNINSTPEYTWHKTINEQGNSTTNESLKQFAIPLNETGWTVPGLAYSRLIVINSTFQHTSQEFVFYSIWVDRIRKKIIYVNNVIIDYNFLYGLEEQDEDYLAEEEENFYNITQEIANGLWTWQHPRNEIKLWFVRRDGNASLYEETFFYYLDESTDTGIYAKYSSIGDISESQLNNLSIVVPEESSNVVKRTYSYERFNNVDYRRIFTNEFVESIDNIKSFYIGNNKLNITNSFLLTPESGLTVPSDLSSPYIVTMGVNVFTTVTYSNVLEEMTKFTYISERSNNIGTDSYLRQLTVNNTVKDTWDNMANAEIYLIQNKKLYKGTVECSYTITQTNIFNTVNGVNTLSGTRKAINTNAVTAKITITELVHEFISFPYSNIMFSKNNLLDFIKYTYSYFKRQFLWTEDDYMFISLGNTFAFNNQYDEDVKLAEIFPMQFDGENIIFREDLLMKEPVNVSVPPTPTSENWYYYDTGYILYNHDS